MTTLHLYKRNGVYYYHETDGSGKTVWRSTHQRSKSNALLYLKHLTDSTVLNTPKLAAFIQQVDEFCKGSRSPATRTMYLACLNHLKDQVGNNSIGEISVQDGERYKALRRGKNLAEVSVNIELRALRATFNLAVKRWKTLSENPFKAVELYPERELVPVAMTQEQAAKLFQAVKEPYLRYLFAFCAATGCRRGEAVNLTWADIDIAGGVVHIRSKKNFKTKNGKTRVVPLSPFAVSIIEVLPRECSYVFSNGGRQLGVSWVSHSFKKYAREVTKDDETPLHFHSLRHTFATLLSHKGVDLYYIQRLLGHSNPRTTMIYTHVVPEDLRKSVSLLGW
jgi:integrase